MDGTQQRRTLPRLDVSLLSHLPPFSKLGSGQIRTILNQATPRRFEAGQAIFHEGDPPDRFYMLLDGYVRVLRITPSGEQVTALHVPSGQIFGISKAMGREAYCATAVTTTEAIVLSWPSSLWDRFVRDYDGFATETNKIIGRRIGEMNNRIVELATQQVEQRVANAVLRLINQTGRELEDGIEVDFPITRQDLSELSATTLHTVSRLLSGWEKQGLIESRRKHIKVRDPAALKALSQI